MCCADLLCGIVVKWRGQDGRLNLKPGFSGTTAMKLTGMKVSAEADSGSLLSTFKINANACDELMNTSCSLSVSGRNVSATVTVGKNYTKGKTTAECSIVDRQIVGYSGKRIMYSALYCAGCYSEENAGGDFVELCVANKPNVVDIIAKSKHAIKIRQISASGLLLNATVHGQQLEVTLNGLSRPMSVCL